MREIDRALHGDLFRKYHGSGWVGSAQVFKLSRIGSGFTDPTWPDLSWTARFDPTREPPHFTFQANLHTWKIRRKFHRAVNQLCQPIVRSIDFRSRRYPTYRRSWHVSQPYCNLKNADRDDVLPTYFPKKNKNSSRFAHSELRRPFYFLFRPDTPRVILSQHSAAEHGFSIKNTLRSVPKK